MRQTRLMNKMKKIVFLTGAGISAESGFSTFRGNNGLWDNYPVEQVATPQGWEEDPNLVTDFYNNLREGLMKAAPNEGHLKVAELEKYFDVTVVTQNVDNLHERAGSSKIIHLHGELMKVCSSDDPDNPEYIETLDNEHLIVKHGELAKDGSLLRPWIVWFGEAVPRMEEATEAVSDADIFVIVGTSLNVYPAAGLINFVPQSAKIYLIDPFNVETPRGYAVEVIQEVASKGMGILEQILLKKS